MNCHVLAQRILEMQPKAPPRDVARLCLLLTNYVEDLSELEDREILYDAWSEMSLLLQAASDQHAAMTEDLEALARTDPRMFDPEQVWTLIRAIKVQSQILHLYLGEPPLDV